MVKISKLVDMGVKAFADDGAKLSTKRAAFKAINEVTGSNVMTRWAIKNGNNSAVRATFSHVDKLLGKEYSKGLRKGALVGVSLTAIPLAYTSYKVYDANKQLEVYENDYNVNMQETVKALEEKEAKIKQLEKELKAKEEAENLYTVKEGDCFWNIAKAQLIEENKDKKDYKPTNAEIKELAEEIMALNNYKYDKNNFNSEPTLYPGDKLKLTA